MLTFKLQPLNSYKMKAYLAIASILLLVYALAVLQDYIYATLRYTRFYISESLLYNTYWLLFIPFLWIANKLYANSAFKSNTRKVIQLSITSILLSGLHVMLFALFFTAISTLVYDPPHRFAHMLNSVVSNQLYISLLVYAFSSPLFKMFNQRLTESATKKYDDRINLKTHKGLTLVEVDTILLLTTERPYTIIHTNQQRYLHDDSLKKLEALFDPTLFFRVHRSVIVNKEHIKTLQSRKNGDFDALLSNGQSVRFSRHYRKNWANLLLH